MCPLNTLHQICQISDWKYNLIVGVVDIVKRTHKTILNNHIFKMMSHQSKDDSQRLLQDAKNNQ